MKKQFHALIAAGMAGLTALAPGQPLSAQDQPPTEVMPARPDSPTTPSLRPLRRFVERVMSDHPALRRAQAELAAARARARGQARPLYNPEIELGYDNALDNSKDVGLSQTLDLSGKRRARAAVASAEVAMAEARLAITRKALAFNLLVALSDAETRAEALRLARVRVRLNRDFLDLARRRNQAGDLPRSELLTARLTLAEALAEESAARAEFLVARERLLALAGALPATLPRLAGIPGEAPPSPKDITVKALPELRLREAVQDAAQRRIQVARRNRIPDPTLGVAIGRENSGGLPGARESTTLFGVRLSVPLPVRNSFRAEVDAAGSDWIASTQDYNDLVRQAEARLRASHDRYGAALTAWQSWIAQGAAPLDEQRRLLQRLWQAGEINAVDYIVQLNQTFATENAGVTLRGQLWTAWFDWLDASGAINDWVETLK